MSRSEGVGNPSIHPLLQSYWNNRIQQLMLRKEEEDRKRVEAGQWRKEVEDTLDKINGRMNHCRDCHKIEGDLANLGSRSGCTVHNEDLQKWRKSLKARVMIEEQCRVDLVYTEKEISIAKDHLAEGSL